MYIKNKKRTFTGKVIQVDEYDLEFKPGQKHTFELVTFDVVTGVSALPVDGDQIMLLKHYQLGLDDIGWSLPTGGLNQDEKPSERMQQELQEELGFKAGKLTLLARIHTLPGYIGTEAGYLFLAQDLSPSKIPGDEPYPIDIVTLPLKKALNMIKSGDIQDSRTILAILYYVQFHHGRTN